MVECICLLDIAPMYLSNFITSIRSGLAVQVVSAQLRGNWQDFNRHDASLGPSAIAELLAFTLASTSGKRLCPMSVYLSVCSVDR